MAVKLSTAATLTAEQKLFSRNEGMMSSLVGLHPNIIPV
jgi:hypothetical protein